MDILNEKIEGLVKKAEKSGMPYGILKKVYDRGMAAWRTGHRPGTTPQQWAFARVNSFVTKSSGTWGGADKDLAKQVKGESTEVPRTKSAKELIGQIKEKLPKDADAGDYVKDFRKSKAPQFKGKSDKKIQKMAIAAYLDSKEEKDLDESTSEYKKSLEKIAKDRAIKALSRKDRETLMKISKMLDKERKKEKDLDEENLQELINFDRQFKDPKKEAMVMFTKGPDKGRGFVIDKKDLPKFERQGAIQIESNDIQESGHQDVPSMKNQVQIAMDALQKMNTELGKLSDEDELPTWWTNKVATAVNKLDGMADYIDAKHDQGQKMNEDNMTEEKVFVVRFEKEGMRFAVPFSDMKRAKDGEKILKKSAGVSNVSITKDILKPGVSMSKFRTRQEGKILPESKMGAFVLEMQIDANEMSERDFIKKYQGEMGMTARELKDLYRQMTEEVKHPMVKAAALATSVWAERRHIDPADIDMKATAADRKAADKNIIIQLRRAQDMEKQTGRADQSGIEFLDKKKQKVDPKIINKALDMFDKMKPNDKQKMQQSIGKSYRDLLKTVQRGRV